LRWTETLASYWSDVLPGFIILGLGVGLVFPAASIASMSEVGEDAAGLASGLITTGHELGTAFGVAAISPWRPRLRRSWAAMRMDSRRSPR
jgi:predicted MFS family arabinose efflux permease